MVKSKLQTPSCKINKAEIDSGNEVYEHYIAVDWSQVNMAVATLGKRDDRTRVFDRKTDIKDLKNYLDGLKGKKIITIEESSSAQWLYCELLDHVNRVLICDPYRNRLLTDGAKNDIIDARKLCLLLKGGLLKEVYHSTSSIYELRKYVSAYEDLIKAGVRLKNQRSAIFRAEGKSSKQADDLNIKVNRDVVDMLDKMIPQYEENRQAFVDIFRKYISRNDRLRHLMAVPGIDVISSVKILANVVDAARFTNKGKYLAYCGLVKHKKISGQRSYGLRNARCNRVMKSVYKTAALAVIRSKKSPEKDYYNYLIEEKHLEEYNARNALARHIAVITYGMLKSGQKYQPYAWRKAVCKKSGD